MNIWCSFRCANRLWSVRLVARVDDEGSDGETNTRTGEILILESLSQEQRFHTLMHELVHVLAYALGWERLDKSEAKVEALGGLLAQILETREGEL